MPGFALPYGALSGARSIAGAPVVVTRPNNANAYAAGQVFGGAVDARVVLAAPAKPGDASSIGYLGLTLLVLNNRPITDVGVPMALFLFRGAPATVLADQAMLNLTDPDIALLVPPWNAAQPLSPQSIGGNLLLSTVNAAGVNYNAAPAGRRLTTVQFQLPPGAVLGFGASVGAYISPIAAYVPIANETLTLTPIWAYA